MRLLFQLPYPGYLRVYGSTVRLLAERGHAVLLAYDAPGKHRDSAAAGIEATPGVEVVPSLPPARRPLTSTVAGIRLSADYLRYLDRSCAATPYLRRRLDKFMEGPTRLLTRAPASVPLAPVLQRLLVAAERLVPSAANVEEALRLLAPDAVVVTPLIARGPSGVRQTDTIKAARALGIPVGLAVASWDHLTTKGVVKVVPDRVFVWNETQRREAVHLHRLPSNHVTVTGAQLFDSWFERSASSERTAFLEAHGLDPASALVLFVGSSPNIAPGLAEIDFARRWLEAVRASPDPSVRSVGVLVRPHPGNIREWGGVDLSALGAVVVPRERPGIPMGLDDEALYFDSIHHAAVVVGINTSAMIESFVQRRPVLTIRDPAFRQTQEESHHFRYLLPAAGGALQAADSFDEHLVQLAGALAEPDRSRDRIDRFVSSFLRPHGLDRPATPILAGAIEALARGGREVNPVTAS